MPASFQSRDNTGTLLIREFGTTALNGAVMFSLCFWLVSCTMPVFPKMVGSKSDFNDLQSLHNNYLRNSEIPVGANARQIAFAIKKNGAICGQHDSFAGEKAGRILCFYAMCFNKEAPTDAPEYFIWEIDPTGRRVTVNRDREKHYPEIRCSRSNLWAAQLQMATSDGRKVI